VAVFCVDVSTVRTVGRAPTGSTSRAVRALAEIVVIAYDGSPASDRAVREGGQLLAGRPAVVVVVWKAGLGFELVQLPTSTVGLPPAPIDIRTAAEIDLELSERAQRVAQKGAGLARDAGLDAEGLAIADDPDSPVAETILRVVRERDARAVLAGSHGHGGVSAALLGSTSRDLIRHAPCPVVVTRGPASG
jgi:nucleotide-binding universal stress UspA family protein